MKLREKTIKNWNEVEERGAGGWNEKQGEELKSDIKRREDELKATKDKILKIQE